MRLPVLGAAMLGTMLLGNVAAHAVSTTVVISEVRFRGSNGSADEIAELYNLSSSPVDISGYVLRGSNASGATGARGTVPANTILQPGRHFLFGGTSYDDGVTKDASMSGTTDDGGVALFLPDGTTLVDAVGLSAGSAYKEGTALTSFGSTNADQSYERKPGGAAGNKTDTDNNSADFTSVASNPQNLSSPPTPTVSGTQTNPTGAGSATPNTVDQGQRTLLTVAVTPGTNPASTGISVIGNLTDIGGSATQQFFDDGTNGDATANDGTYSFLATVAMATTPGSKNLPVTISDAQARTGNASIVLTVNQVFPASTTVVISEFRSRGAAGTADEFVELYNLSNAAVDISGYTLQYSSSTGSNPAVRATIGMGITLPAGQHYLLAAIGSPLESQANTTFDAFIADNGGIGLFDAAGNRVDAVGQASGTQLKEGTALAAFPSPNDNNQSYERLPLTVNNRDTQNNANDFQLTNSNPQALGAAANTAPVFNNATYNAGLNDRFSVQLAATDRDAGNTLTYTSNNLPAFLSLTPSGVLSGQPTSAGTFRFSVTVNDGNGGTATANFALVVRDVPAASDTTGPVVTRNQELPMTLTRDQLAAFTLAGTVQDVAPMGATVSGVRRLLVQLRTRDNAQAYNGSTFTTNTSQGYYVATLAAGGSTDVRNYSRSLSFVPSNLAPGDYSIVSIAQDNAGNYTLEVLPFTIVASPAAARFAPSTIRNGSGGSS